MKRLWWIAAGWMTVPWLACGWGGGHDVVARAVAERLPEPWRTTLHGERLERFCRDNHYPDARTAFAEDPRVIPEERAFLTAHAMKDSGALHADEGRVAAFALLTRALREKRIDSVSLWLGALAHATADMAACNHDPVVHLATNAYATLSLQAGAWPRRRLVRDPCFEAGWHIPSNTTLFTPEAVTWITPLVTLFDRETAHVVGAAWPKDAPTVAYLPTYSVYPYLWTDEKPSLVPLELDLDTQGSEALNLAFAALKEPELRSILGE